MVMLSGMTRETLLGRAEQITYANRVNFKRKYETINTAILVLDDAFQAIVKEGIYACKVDRLVIAQYFNVHPSAVTKWVTGEIIVPQEARPTVIHVLVSEVTRLLLASVVNR